MQAIRSQPLGREWKDRLDLSNRRVPELYEHAGDVGIAPHAGAIRKMLSELGASAVFCVQEVPTIAILWVDDYDRAAIVDLHAKLWNQGLASLLLVISGDTVRAFSLARTPRDGESQRDFDDRCLVREFNAVSDALMLRDVVYGAESGRLWKEHAEYFHFSERIDQVLLDNLATSYRLLSDDTGLSPDAAQALLVQVMFIAYLEDREIILPEVFESASDGRAGSFSDLLRSEDIDSLDRLFESLRRDFNGDLFVAPCSFDENDLRPPLTPTHLNILRRFHSGHVEMHGNAGQHRFWGYDFKYIPIELISAVYDRFLGENDTQRRAQGAYYTPMFLADTVISQVWDTLSGTTKETGHFLDPACGSGVFLVRSFQRMCEHWRDTRTSRTIRWDSLLVILSRLHGWDIDSGSIRVAVFSLYIALLEEVSPPDIRRLIRRGRFLPTLWGENLRHRDFFEIRTDETRADVVIGNPPWSSRPGAGGENRPSVKWCEAERLPMPGKEDAWAFVWKSLRHLRDGGIVAFLLPAMAFLHNHAKTAVSARKRLVQDVRIFRIINFADLRFQLFEGAVRPAALIIFGHSDREALAYRFEYWTPKADLNLKIRRLITLSSADKCLVTSTMAAAEPLVFKQRLWMNDPESKLFNYLSAFPKLGDLVDEYGSLARRRRPARNGWIIGQGFKPANVDRLSDSDYEHGHSDTVANTPYLPISALRALAQTRDGLRFWKNGTVHRKGFERGFYGPRVLIPQGVDTIGRRLRATYLEAPLTFQHIIQSLVVPRGEERRAKLLTALLNSRLIAWFAFHGTASFGSERPKVQQADLLTLPFPSPDDMPQRERSESAANALVASIDRMIEAADGPFGLREDERTKLEKIDHLTYEFFCLSDEEVVLVDDTVERIIPSIQPRRSQFPDIWKPADRDDRQSYADALIGSMAAWLDPGCTIGVELQARNDDLAVLRLTVEDGRKKVGYTEKDDRSVGRVLAKLFEHIHQPLSGNFQLIPDFRIFVGNHLYLVKPARRRFWLKSAALADADAIALDLQDAVARNRRSPA